MPQAQPARARPALPERSERRDIDRIVLREVLKEFLPIDDEHRHALRVHLAYYVRSLNDPELAAASSPTGPRWKT